MPSDNETPQPLDEGSPAAPSSPADSRSEEGEARSDDSPRESRDDNRDDAPPLPNESVPGTQPSTERKEAGHASAAAAPPLPNEAPPGQEADDGWSAEWDATHQVWYFYNRFTGVSQWDNPRVPTTSSNSTAEAAPSSSSTSAAAPPPLPAETSASAAAISQLNSVAGGYNPAIHGSWDPTAPYAQAYQTATGDDATTEPIDPIAAAAAGGAAGGEDGSEVMLYGQNAAFNRQTGKFQLDDQNPERYSDANKSHRQMNAYFDVDRAANSHDGRSLKAERRGKQPTKKELTMWKEKRKARKEEKRRAWLRD